MDRGVTAGWWSPTDTPEESGLDGPAYGPDGAPTPTSRGDSADSRPPTDGASTAPARAHAAAPVRALDPRLRTLYDTVAAAARSLEPVVVDFGRAQPKLSSFVDRFAMEGDAPTLVLAPIAVDAIPPPALQRGGARIVSVDPRRAWELVVDEIRPGPGASALVPLARARLALASSSRSVLALGSPRESLVVLLPVSAGTAEVHIFPVLAVGSRECVFESCAPFEPGTELGDVKLVGGRRLLRQSSALIVEVEPWRTADGAQRFRSRLVFDDGPPRASGSDADLVAEPAQIKHVLELATMMQVTTWFDVPGKQRQSVRLVRLDEHSLVATGLRGFEMPWRSGAPTQPASYVRVGFDAFGRSYEMDVRVLSVSDAQLELSLPLFFKRRRRRREERTIVPPDRDIVVAFTNPSNGTRSVRRLLDLSFGGLSFQLIPGDEPFWRGMPLDDVEVRVDGRRIRLGELDIRALGEGNGGRGGTVHAEYRSDDASDQPDVVALIAQLRHPEVVPHDGEDLPGLLDVYGRAGLLAPFITRNIEPVRDAIADTWRRMHDAKNGLAFSLVYESAGKPQATATGVHAWDRTWLAQHFGAIATGAGQASGAVHVAYLDHVLPRPEAHYLIFFVKADNAIMNSFQERFLSITGSPEAVSRITLDYWIHDSGADPVAAQPAAPRNGVDVQLLPRESEPLVARAAERLIGTIPARALALVPGGFGLPETEKHFAKVGLTRRRTSYLVTRNGVPASALFYEHTSPGVNFTWMLNAWWLLPIHPHLDEGGEVTGRAAEAMLREPPVTAAGDRFLITVSGTPGEATLERYGWKKIAPVHLFVLNRSGLHRYMGYISDRYGELGARTARRRAMRAGKGAG